MLTKRTLGLGIGLIMLLAFSAAFSWLVRGCVTVNQTVPLLSIEEAASQAGVQFPPGSRLIGGEWHNALNTFGYAKVELPPDGVTPFFKQPLFGGVIQYAKQPPEDEYEINVAQCPHDPKLLRRWNLMRVKKSASADGGVLNGGLGSHFPVAAFVDLDQPEHPVLYVHWYD